MTMKFFLFFMFVAVALAAQDSDVSQDEVAQILARSFRMDLEKTLECVRTSEVTMEDMRYMEVVIDLDNTETMDMKSLRRASCALVCCIQKLGLMRGGEVLVEEMFKFYQKTGMPEEMQIPLRVSVRVCKEQVTDTSDECMAGYKFIKCEHQRRVSTLQYK